MNGLRPPGAVAFLLRGGDVVKNRGVVLISLWAMVLTGCLRRSASASLPSLMIPVSCASEITLVQCDARVSPPRCKSARVKYRSGCEEIVVRGK
jgi:hypothetical protein